MPGDNVTTNRRLLMCYHVNTGDVNHYVGDKPVDAETFRRVFRRDADKLTPALPQSTGFGYRVVWEREA